MRQNTALSIFYALAAGGILLALASCGSSGGGSNGGGQMGQIGGVGGGGATPACSGSDFSSQIVAICKKQFPSGPGPRQIGAACGNSYDCDSNYCMMPFGSPSYCSIRCGTDACPPGFDCQDTGNGFAACYRGVCAYGGSDSADCVTRLTREAATACQDNCKQQVSDWLGCIQRAPLLCARSEAHAACGIERGLLDSCCAGCDSQDL